MPLISGGLSAGLSPRLRWQESTCVAGAPQGDPGPQLHRKDGGSDSPLSESTRVLLSPLLVSRDPEIFFNSTKKKGDKNNPKLFQHNHCNKEGVYAL